MIAKRLGRALVSTAIVGLCACSTPKSTPPGPADLQPPTSTPLAYALKAAPDDPALLDGPQVTTFNINSMQYLVARLITPTISQDINWVNLSLTGPNGVLYETQRVPFSTDYSKTTIPSPMDSSVQLYLKRPTPVPGGYYLDLSMAIAGTEIQLRPVVGTWKLAGSIDGQSGSNLEIALEFGGGL